MRTPRDLATTLPSPSELDNCHRCPCIWYLKDRLWIKTRKEVMAYQGGRVMDTVLNTWLTHWMNDPRNSLAVTTQDVLNHWDEEVEKLLPQFEADELLPLMASCRDALVAWLTLYGNVRENVLLVQPKFTSPSTGKLDYVVEEDGMAVLRERKVISPFADIDDEIAKYQLGFQPSCYSVLFKRNYVPAMEVKCVEMEFLIRSAPGRGRYKPVPAEVRRAPIYVTDWKERMWQSSATATNEYMKWLESCYLTGEVDCDTVAFEMIPRHTRNCIVKLGNKSYPCEFHKACLANIDPRHLDDYVCELEDASGDSKGP